MAKSQNFIKKISAWYFKKSLLPYWAILMLDTLIVFLSALFAYWISRGSYETFQNHRYLILTSLVYAGLSVMGARAFHTYSGVIRYSSFVDLLKVLYANALTLVSAIGVSLVAHYYNIEWANSLTVLQTVGTFVLATLLMILMRVTVKLIFDAVNQDKQAMRVLVYGALKGGVGLAKNVNSQIPRQFEVVGFISHEHRIKNSKLLDLPVYMLEDDIAYIIRKRKIQGVLVSPLRVDDFRSNQKIQDIFIGEGCTIFLAHAAEEAMVQNGEISDTSDGFQLREVSVEDLLPRQQINVDLKSVGEQLSGKRVLITGSAGSIGLEIVRQVASFGPSKLMLIDQAETPQHDLRLMMKRDFPGLEAETVVASIDRQTRMENIFEIFRPEYVFHAAAYKHVPMMEDNPSEAVLNNIRGTKIIADLSVKYGARKFVMISTDKAVNPTNVMGCSKRICEIYVQSLDRKLKLEAMEKAQGISRRNTSDYQYTQFVTTRFGNVLGSNGSVIPLFREQIKQGGPVTVTDERIVRFFMLIPEACRLVLEAGTKGNGGEIFVFDMGEPVRIADLAKRMIALSGAKNVEIKFTGLREGEKLYEEVLNELENTKPTFHPKIRIAMVREYDYDEVNREIEDLIEIAKRYDNMETVRKMKFIVPEYKSNNSVYEALDSEDSGGGYKKPGLKCQS